MVTRASRLGLAIALGLVGCKLDLGSKTACRDVDDCVGGRVCTDGWCVFPMDASTDAGGAEAGPHGDPDAAVDPDAAADPDAAVGPDAAGPDAASLDSSLQSSPDAAPEAGTGDGGADPPADCSPLFVAPLGTGSGASWGEAEDDLRAAIDLAHARVQEDCETVEIWVAEGTYRPQNSTSRSATFELHKGVALYGGFVGGETAREARDPRAHLTVLSGDRQADDSTGNLSDNCFNVVRATNVDESARLDGFVITAGNSEGPGGRGGGLLYSNASPSLEQLVFVGNRASYSGGGLSGLGGHPKLRATVFAANVSDLYGGAADFSMGQATLDDVTFVANAADAYGAVVMSADVTMSRVRFVGNVTDLVTGAAGAIGATADAELDVQNALFVGNVAFVASALLVGQHATIVGATFARNLGDDLVTGNAIGLGTSGSLELRNSVLWDNQPTAFDEAQLGRVTFITSNVQDLANPPSGNLSVDPQFVGSPSGGGSWSVAPAYDPALLQTVFTDAAANFQALTGAIVRLRTESSALAPRHSVIVRHTATQLWVWGDLSEHARQADHYELFDFRLKPESPCIGGAESVGDADHDIEGTPRDAEPDMGAYEWAP